MAIHPALAILINRSAVLISNKVGNWWNQPTKIELQKVRELQDSNKKHFRIQAEKNRLIRVPDEQVSTEAKLAYAKALKLWKGGLFTKSNRHHAEELIRFAAEQGLSDAQVMARLHGIDFKT